MVKRDSMYLIEFTGAKYFERDIILPYWKRKRGQELPQHCHKRNHLVGMNSDLLFNLKKSQYAFDWIQEDHIFWKKTLFYPSATNASKGSRLHCHKNNQLVGMNTDLWFNLENRQYAFDWIHRDQIFWKRHYSTLLPLTRPTAPPTLPQE